MRFALVTNVLVLETNALKRTFKLPPHTAISVATSNFQAELLSKLLLTRTHLQKWAVTTLSYSTVSTLHPQVIYAIAFSAGLNGLQVDEVDRENDKRTSTPLAACTTCVQYPRCGVTIRATPTQLLRERPTRSVHI